jgi:predicted dehydrogenase/nucleoside-diphosphate-sugar epimerase
VSDLRLAVVGCGAAARRCHLPAIPRVPGVTLTTLVDPDLSHAAEASEVYRAAGGAVNDIVLSATLVDALPHFDAAVVAAPHTVHAEIADILLDGGKHVLMEKPMTAWPSDAERLDRAVRNAPQTVFAMAHPRRLFPASMWLRNLLSTGYLGRVRRIEWREGHPYSWNPTTTSMFAPQLAGGGVVTDTGSHVFDLLLWWFGPDVTVIDYLDNSLGGVETDARIVLSWGETEAHVELSRIRSLGTACTVAGTSASATVGTDFPTATCTLVRADGQVLPPGDAGTVPLAPNAWKELFAQQLRGFTAAIREQATPYATAEDGRRVVDLIESCYRGATRRAWLQPWISATTGMATRAESRQRVAVTGASGFIGGRVVEKLILESTTPVRAIVRGFGRLARLSPLPQERLEFAVADINDQPAVTEALTDCAAVVHCALGNTGTAEERYRTTVHGTATALAAAQAAGVRRFIHLSTSAVYDPTTPGRLDESAPSLPETPDHIGCERQQLAGERLALAANGAALESVVLQPAIVYGPWARQWTTAQLERLPAYNAVLPTGDQGHCNAVYVDDVVDAVLLVLKAPNIAGERFLISGAESVSWGAFFDAYRNLLQLPLPVESPALPGTTDWERELYGQRSVISIDHAQKRIGYRPRTSLRDGMALVGTWARWTGYLNRTDMRWHNLDYRSS